MSGKPWSDEQKARASLRMRGKHLSATHRAAISRGQMGNRRGPEVGEKIRSKHLGRIGTLEDRFWRLVDSSGGTDACWPWLGRRDEDGYGMTIGKRPPERVAHRMAFLLTYGPIPKGLLGCHSCDNPWCCNPLHTFIGSNADNARDRCAKGRSASLSGINNPMFEKTISRERNQDGTFI